MLCCMYGLSAFFIASKEILSEYNINAQGKFRSLQGTVVTLVVPTLIVSFIGIKEEDGEKYTSEVMKQAYSSFITLVLMVFLAFSMRNYYGPEDALKAFENFDARHANAREEKEIRMNV